MNETKTHDTMSPEAQRITIAEARGWTCIERINRFSYGGLRGVDPTGESKIIPSYLTDLNSCHEFEIWLLKNHPDLRAVYRRILIECVGFGGLYWMATAPQRCKAFLRTIKKWAHHE